MSGTHWHPHGFGGHRTDPERIKREGWSTQGILVVQKDDKRLSWPEKELIQQVGEKLYGKRPDKGGQHG
ncbi:MAG: hypothetical protein PHS57_10210 [Alphaproteobacteria bacterium]|nr:hypothetical protein [Alphaproteobacteria bacterium]